MNFNKVKFIYMLPVMFGTITYDSPSTSLDLSACIYCVCVCNVCVFMSYIIFMFLKEGWQWVTDYVWCVPEMMKPRNFGAIYYTRIHIIQIYSTDIQLFRYSCLYNNTVSVHSVGYESVIHEYWKARSKSLDMFQKGNGFRYATHSGSSFSFAWCIKMNGLDIFL